MASTPSTTFKYSPLNHERAEIRLLQLLPSANRWSPIACELEHVSLDDDDIRYEALSYTWGTNARTDSIALIGTAFPVTSSLFTALRALRQEHLPRYLWIDAVCINQEDVSERNQEVLRMLRIYQRAERVVIWLGEASDDSALAINHLRNLNVDWNFDHDRKMTARMIRLSTKAAIRAAVGTGTIIGIARSRPFLTTWAVAYFARLIPATTGLTSLASRAITYWSFLELGLSFVGIYRLAIKQVVDKMLVPDATTVKALEGFFTRAWFRRVWIVQEIGAARDAILLCGQDSISWRDMCRACDWMETLIARTSTRNAYIDCQFRRCRGIRQVFNPNKPSSEKVPFKWNLLLLLTHFSSFGATDPRDKVYGLLGLASDVQQQDEESDMMVPDYNKPLATVYAETTRFVVTRTGRLDILRVCEGFHRMPGLPSWTPDWTCNVFRSANTPVLQTKPYNLSSDPFPAQPVARFLDVPLTMTVRGFIIGHLVDSGQILFKLPDPTKDSQFREAGGGYMDLVMKYFAPNIVWLMKSGIFGFCAKSIIRLLIRLYPELNAPLTPYFGLVDDLVNVSMENPGNSNGDVDSTMPQVMENIFGPSDAEAEEKALRSVNWKPILKKITMDPGHCHTYAPSPQGGDLVCMFIGAGEPYILRKDGDYYVLLNSATFGPFNRYLWGDCEREHREGTLTLQDFKLI
jgi:Heterokaryon incompatibility protein (HET)